MPNGRGFMECGYCLHWSIDIDEWGYEACHREGRCNCWDITIAESSDHRFCLDFTPNPYFAKDNGVGIPGEDRTVEEIVRDNLLRLLAEKPDMKIRVLYGYSPQRPEVFEIMPLTADPVE